METIEAVVFDLDGVVTDTARFHFVAWKRLADELSIPFDEDINQRLKGVDRRTSLDILLAQAPDHCYSEIEKSDFLERKNGYYLQYLASLSQVDILSGITGFLGELTSLGIKKAIYSSSKNAPTVLSLLGLSNAFDVVVTGMDVSYPKPDYQGYLLAAYRLNVPPKNCLMIEDSSAGLQGGRASGMKTLGIGEPKRLANVCDFCIVSTDLLHVDFLQQIYPFKGC